MTKDRSIIFRLEKNPLVIITDISRNGAVAYDGRSAYSCSDKNGEIEITLFAQPGAANEEQNWGRLWGIDGKVKNGCGVYTDFEVDTP